MFIRELSKTEVGESRHKMEILLTTEKDMKFKLQIISYNLFCEDVAILVVGDGMLQHRRTGHKDKVFKLKRSD